MGMRADKVIQESGMVRELFYHDGYICNRIRDCQFQQYISYNNSNDDVLDSVLSEKGIKLVIAPTGSGKSTSILSRANLLVSKDKDYKVIFALPTRALTLQMGTKTGVKSMTGGDSFDENSPIIATTYEKMYEVKDYIERQGILGKKGKIVLVLDESHLLTTQHLFRENAIKRIIRCIEKQYFHSVVLVTATPAPMSLFRCDEIVEFKNSSSLPNIDKLEIIAVDDVAEYIKSIDYDKEFPFIRLNNTQMIDALTASMPQVMVRISKDDKDTRAYLDIVDEGKIDSTGINGIIATSVIEAGVSIVDYPDNIVPMAVFPDNNISADDIEQFLNRIRRNGNKNVKCARVILTKPKHREIKVSLLSKDGTTALCEFQDMEMKMGNLIVNDTMLMDVVADGNYSLRFEIGDIILNRKFTVASKGMTGGNRYSKDNPMPILFEDIGFRPFIDHLKANYGLFASLKDSFQMFEEIFENNIQTRKLNENPSDMEISFMQYNKKALMEQITKGAFAKMGEMKDVISYEDGNIVFDQRICYMISYKQFQRQYYHNHDILAEELKNRLGTNVELFEKDTAKGKRIVCNDNNIWENIEHLRQIINSQGDNLFWEYIMGNKKQYLYCYSKRNNVIEVREQTRIMELLKSLEKAGIYGNAALKIISSSKCRRKITEYCNCYYMIINNKSLEQQFQNTDISKIPYYKGKNDTKEQYAIYCCLTQKGQGSYKITDDLAEEIIEFYKKSYPSSTKLPKVRKIKKKIRQMYKSKGRDTIRNELRTDVNDIFSLVEPDYK